MTLRDFYLKRAKAEFPVFLKVLRALPSDLSYKPDERSPSAEQLVWTVTYELKALIDVVETGKCEWQNITPPGLDEMIGMYEKWSTEVLDKVANLDDASQERNAQFLYQGQVIMEKPLVEFLWDFMFDAIHHRGQLSAYLRPMGGKVPSMFMVFVEVMFDGYDIAPQAAAVLSKRDATIRDSMNVLAQIGVAAAVAIPVLACVNA